MAQLYLDECVSLYLKGHLATFGHDVTHAIEVNNRRRADYFHLKYAVDTDRVLITANQSDFRFLHRLHKFLQSWNVLQTPHHGIFASGVTRNLDEQAFAAAIHTLLGSLPQPPTNDMYTWHPRGGWYKDGW